VQENHPDGLVIAKLGDATGQFQLDLYRQTAQMKELLRKYEPLAFQLYDTSAAFRWSETSAANSLCAQLALATLASAANGAVPWRSAKEGFVTGDDACKRICKSALNEAKTRAGKEYKFSKQDLFGPWMSVQVVDNWTTCPRCGTKFNVTSQLHCDGEKHLKCGQLILLTPKST
jgi:hypothetical protein